MDDAVFGRIVELAERRVRLQLELDAVEDELEQIRSRGRKKTRTARASAKKKKPPTKKTARKKRARKEAPAPSPKAGRPFGKEAAIGFLRETLKKGPMLTSEVMDLANKQGFTPSTMQRARVAIGIVSEKIGDGMKSRLRLP